MLSLFQKCHHHPSKDAEKTVCQGPQFTTALHSAHVGPPYAYLALLLGDFFAMGPLTTLTKRLAYKIRFLYRPVGGFFLSIFCTFGVCFFTFLARANEPWTFPILWLLLVYRDTLPSLEPK